MFRYMISCAADEVGGVKENSSTRPLTEITPVHGPVPQTALLTPLLPAVKVIAVGVPGTLGSGSGMTSTRMANGWLSSKRSRVESVHWMRSGEPAPLKAL